MSRRWPQVQLVESFEASARVLFDLHDHSNLERWQSYPTSDLSLGAPQWDGEPDGWGGEYGLREITVPWTIMGSRSNALRVMTRLAREMQRPRGFLRIQIDETQTPRWFALYRPEMDAPSWENVRDEETSEDRWDVDLTFTAEALAYGPRETLLSSAPVPVNPATAGGIAVALPALRGDAPAGLEVTMHLPGATGIFARRPQFTVATATPGSGSPAPIFWQASAFPIASGTSGVSDSGASAGSFRRRPASSTWGDLLAGTPAAVPPIGRYLAMARMRGTNASVRLGLGLPTGEVSFKEAVPLNLTSYADGRWTWVPLGVVDLPSAFPAAARSRLAPVATGVSLQVSTTGSDPVDADVIALVPIGGAGIESATTLRASFFQQAPRTIFDTDNELVYGSSDDGLTAARVVPPELSGHFPRATPGAQNTLMFFANVGADGYDNITTSISLSISYRPRYLWLGEG